MHSAMSIRKVMVGLCLFALCLFASCSKEELDGPMPQPLGASKSKVDPMASSSDGDQNGSDGGHSVNGNNDGINDDGDDVGDGERNKKRRTN